MDADAQPRDARKDDSPSLESMRFLLLGETSPAVPDLNIQSNIESHPAAIILTKSIESAELINTLARASDPALPIADFSGSQPLRRDYVGSKLDSEGISEMKKRFAPIWRRLEALPFRAQREDRDALTMLRIAYSRDTSLKAEWAPDSKLTVQYPLVGSTVGMRRQLEALANMDMLRRRHFARTHACSKCGSARLNVYEACPGCKGADLIEEVVIHHYRCGCQEPESHFVQDKLLICPKCRRELRHFGVDYDKPGKVVLCRTCGATNTEPLVHLVCMDCSTITPSEVAAATDWYHYDLTDEGMSSLREGRLPRFKIDPRSERGLRAFSPSEFRLLASKEFEVARQYRRPFSIARISFPNMDAVRRDLGTVGADAAVQATIEKIVATVRPSDFVGINDDASIVIGLPETAARDCSPIEEQIRRIAHDTGSPFELTFDVAEGDAVIEMFA